MHGRAPVVLLAAWDLVAEALSPGRDEGPVADLLDRAVLLVLADADSGTTAAREVRGRAFAVLERTDAPPAGLPILVESAMAAAAPAPLAAGTAAPDVVAVSRPMRAIVERLAALAGSRAPCLVLGAAGTGKRTLAMLTHARSVRARHPFLVLGLAALDAADLELALDGALRAAGAGTLVLDGVHALTSEGQDVVSAALAAPGPTRVFGTGSPSMRDAERKGTFRPDLFLRLGRHVIDVPALADRPDDIPVLAYTFARSASDRLGLPQKRIALEALRALRSARWEGNVPELEACVVSAVANSSRDVLTASDFGLGHPSAPADVPRSTYVAERREQLASFERSYVDSVLARAGGNVTRAAELAGMDRANFRRLMKRARKAEPRQRKREP